MSTFVLVHGAWHGGWCWKKVRGLLEGLGHVVHTPTLTGLGERSHLLSLSVTLQTHIDDIVNLLRWEELDDVVLCGHSYGGIVATGVAEAAPERIGALVYLDAFLPESGQNLLETLPPDLAHGLGHLVREHGEGWLVPAGPAAFFEVNAEERDWVDRQCTPQPLATFEHPLVYSDAALGIRDTRYILATGWQNSHFGPFAATARRRGWPVIELASGHDAMLDNPRGLVEILCGP